MQALAAADAVNFGFPAVREAILERALAGAEKYGTYLFDNNGRDPVVDAMQEALDLVVYLKQCVVENREGTYFIGMYRDAVGWANVLVQCVARARR